MLDSSSDSPNQNRLMHIYVFVPEQWMLFISQRTKGREHFGDTHTRAQYVSVHPDAITSIPTL